MGRNRVSEWLMVIDRLIDWLIDWLRDSLVLNKTEVRANQVCPNIYTELTDADWLRVLQQALKKTFWELMETTVEMSDWLLTWKPWGTSVMLEI